MGLLIDSCVFIHFERNGGSVDLSQWDADERVVTSVIVASELLVGVHRAKTPEQRERRAAFVEGVLKGIEAVEVTLGVARSHAAIHAELAGRGELIGAHDMIIAARFHDLAVLTDNVRDFSKVPGLKVIPFKI